MPRTAMLLALTALACAARTQNPAADGATAWGFVSPAHPGFSVVYLEGPPQPAKRLELRIRGRRIEPAFSAVPAGSTLAVHNAGRRAYVLADPVDDVVRTLQPGEGIEIHAAESGARSLFLVDVPGGSEATVFVSPGPFAVVSPRGRFELRRLAPGRQRLYAWGADERHIYSWIRVEPDAVQRFDLGVR